MISESNPAFDSLLAEIPLDNLDADEGHEIVCTFSVDFDKNVRIYVRNHKDKVIIKKDI